MIGAAEDDDEVAGFGFIVDKNEVGDVADGTMGGLKLLVCQALQEEVGGFGDYSGGIFWLSICKGMLRVATIGVVVVQAFLAFFLHGDFVEVEEEVVLDGCQIPNDLQRSVARMLLQEEGIDIAPIDARDFS